MASGEIVVGIFAVCDAAITLLAVGLKRWRIKYWCGSLNQEMCGDWCSKQKNLGCEVFVRALIRVPEHVECSCCACPCKLLAMAQVVHPRYFHLLVVLCFHILQFGHVEGAYLPVGLGDLFPKAEGEHPK